MDEWVRNKLLEWNLEKLKEIFEENEVDEESFKCLGQENMKKLITKLGPQSKFLKNWQSEFEIDKKIQDAQVIVTPTFPCPEDNIPFNSKALDPTSDNGSQVLENEDHIECNPIIIDMYPYDEEISINTCEPITDILKSSMVQLWRIPLF